MKTDLNSADPSINSNIIESNFQNKIGKFNTLIDTEIQKINTSDPQNNQPNELTSKRCDNLRKSRQQIISELKKRFEEALDQDTRLKCIQYLDSIINLFKNGATEKNIHICESMRMENFHKKPSIKFYGFFAIGMSVNLAIIIIPAVLLQMAIIPWFMVALPTVLLACSVFLTAALAWYILDTKTELSDGFDNLVKSTSFHLSSAENTQNTDEKTDESVVKQRLGLFSSDSRNP